MFCKFCGSQIDDNAFICPNCGKQLGTSTAPPPPQVWGQTTTPSSGMSGMPNFGTAENAVKQLPIKTIIRVTLIAVLVVFFLPFMTVSCGSSKDNGFSVTYSGFDMMVAANKSDDSTSSDFKSKAGDAKPNIFVIGAFAAGIAAAAMYFVKNDHKKASVCSIAGAGLLVVARILFSTYYGLGEYASYFNIEMRWGMILAILLFLANAAMCFVESQESP